MMEMGWKAWKWRKEAAERLLQSGGKKGYFGAFVLAPIQSGIFLWKKRKQGTQGKQDEQAGGGSGGTPPPPPDIKPEGKKEERPKPTGIDTYSPISIPNPFKKKE
jgi:hypothetical protein